MPFTFVDLFAGIGGFRIALESLGGRCVFSCEINERTRRCYEDNFGHSNEFAADIRKVRMLPRTDVLCAGFPCQPFSVAGSKKGMQDKSRGLLVDEIFRLVRARRYRPRVVLLENVPNIMRFPKMIKHLEREFGSLGYELTWQPICSSLYNAPQTRNRIYFVALLQTVASRPMQWPDAGLSNWLRRRKEARVLGTAQADVRSVLQPFDEVPVELHVPGGMQMFPPENHKKDQRFICGDRLRQSHRLFSIDYPAPTVLKTLRNKFFDDRTDPPTVRYLTMRETTRLMGFPDSFSIDRLDHSMLGNAVVPQVIADVAKRAIECIPAIQLRVARIYRRQFHINPRHHGSVH